MAASARHLNLEGVCNGLAGEHVKVLLTDRPCGRQGTVCEILLHGLDCTLAGRIDQTMLSTVSRWFN